MEPTPPIPGSADPVLDTEAAERLARKAAYRVRIRILLVVLALTGIGAVLGAKPAWRQVKAWRADKMAADGEAFHAAGQVESAFGKARAALQVAAKSPRALRLAAKTTREAGSPLALHYLRELANTPAATLEDRQDLAQVALLYEDFRVASNSLAILLAPSNPPPRTLQLAAQYRLLIGDVPSAIQFGRELMRVDGDNPTNHLGLASSLAMTREATNREEARLILLKLAEGPSESRLPAMEFLASTDFGTPTEARAVATILEHKDNRTSREKIALAQAWLRGSPASRADALRLLRTNLDFADAEGVVRTMACLANHREFALTLALLDAEHARTNSSFFRARLNALVEGGFAEQAYQAALAPPNPKWFEELDLELVRYRIAARLTNANLLDEHRQRMLSVAGRDAKRLRRLVAFAEREGIADLTAAAAQTWSNIPGESAEALPHLMRAMDRQGDTPGARTIIRRLIEANPKDIGNQLRLAHFNALLGEYLPEAVATAKPHFEDPGLALHARMIAALAYLRQGDTTNAVLCLTAKLDTKSALPPSYLAISAAVNGASGRDLMARMVASTIPLGSLRLEEKELIRPYLPPPSPLVLGQPTAPAASIPPANPKSR